jgi:hypothetical protein
MATNMDAGSRQPWPNRSPKSRPVSIAAGITALRALDPLRQRGGGAKAVSRLTPVVPSVAPGLASASPGALPAPRRSMIFADVAAVRPRLSPAWGHGGPSCVHS